MAAAVGRVEEWQAGRAEAGEVSAPAEPGVVAGPGPDGTPEAARVDPAVGVMAMLEARVELGEPPP
jgi:hypothetical protein